MSQYPHKSKKGIIKNWKMLVYMVGTARFELATPCPPDKCATRLRHAPTGLQLIDKDVLCLSAFMPKECEYLPTQLIAL